MTDDTAKNDTSLMDVLSWILMIIGILLSIFGLVSRFSGSEPQPEAIQLTADQVYALQSNCFAADLHYDANGACYEVNPATLDPSERTAATVAPPGGLAIPATPVDPNAPANPATPTGPIDPAAPTGPVAPVEPNAPANPATPTGPAAPVDPEAGPTEPVPPAGSEPAPAPRDSIRLDLPFGFDPDPRTRNLPVTGGAVNVGANLPGCEGFASEAPDVVLNYTNKEGGVAGSSGLPMRVFFVADTPGEDAVLIINDAFGDWYCNDAWQAGTTDPMLTFLDGPYGIYDVWVASATESASVAGTIVITEKPLNPGS